MSIVFITIPGSQKKEFANELHTKTGGGISLVIVQKTKYVSWKERFRKLKKTVGYKGLITEFYYVIHMRLNSQYRNYLKYFFLRTKKEGNADYLPKVLEVENINSDEVYTALQNLKPKLLVVWGANILEPRIFESADKAINLHMGLGEHYRGSVANHFAVLEDNKVALGAMIHRIDKKMDSGDIYKTILANLQLPPKDLFTQLNDQAFLELSDISYKLWSGENLPTFKQNIENGKNVLLREWTPSRRCTVAKKIIDWERGNE